jgi:NAD-dependent deacetylase
MSIEKLYQWIDKSDNIVFFGGAGVSTESNIPDFRSAEGLYSKKYHQNYSPEEMISHDFFINHTDLFYEFYKNKMIYPDAQPNSAHIALAKLEKEGKLQSVITQNIDGLHQLAGSTKVHELHGSVHRNFCMDCGEYYTLNAIIDNSDIPYCKKCGGIIKPDVVLYGEQLNESIIMDAIKDIQSADLLLVAGTSLTVYPAANFITYYKGDKLVLVNKSKTPYDHQVNLVITEKIGKVLNYYL